MLTTASEKLFICLVLLDQQSSLQQHFSKCWPKMIIKYHSTDRNLAFSLVLTLTCAKATNARNELSEGLSTKIIASLM